MIEKIARHLCRADGYDPDLVGTSGSPRWWLYTRTAEHTIPLLAEAWDEGDFAGQVNAHEHRAHKKMQNPYRQEKDA